IRICIGWKISVTGVFPVSYGGDIGYLLGTIRKQVKCMSVEKHRKTLKIGSKMKTCLIRGVHQLCGLFRRWDGQTRKQKTLSVIFHPMYLYQVTTLFSSVLPA